MTLATLALLSLAAALGGALNSVVGGGSFVAFPALVLAGVPAVSANATTAFALWPATLASTVAYREDLPRSRAYFWPYGLASFVGGGLGGALLLGTSDRTFVKLIPWLLLFAATLFSFGGALTQRLRGAHHRSIAIGAVIQLVIATYGGYFGGGMGIMMLATWTALGMTDLHAMNGLRTFLAVVINGVAVAAFLVAGAVAWVPGLVMAVSATAAGYGGAWLARRVDARHVRRLVMAVAWAMTVYFFVRAYA